MSGETLIRVVEDILLEDGCTHAWRYNPLGEHDGELPNYWCGKHEAHVPLSGPCPKSDFWARKGETVSVPSKVARRLVEAELAEYPTHSPEPEQGVQDTLTRMNALLEAQGLPLMNAEGMRVWKVEGQRTHYERPVKPRDARLADDLGLDALDVEEMRRLAGGS